MKADLDRLMQEAGLDALFILGPASHNPTMTYFTGRANLTHAELLLRRGEPAVLFHQPMEREEAAATGLRTRNVIDYDERKLLQQTGGDAIEATMLRYRRMFEEYGVHGRASVYGKVEVGPYWSLLRRLEAGLEGVELVGEPSRSSVLSYARATKDAAEVERIRAMGTITTEVVGKVAGYLTERRTDGEILLGDGGDPLTVGEVKRKIDLWLAERGAENPEGTILALGRDAGVPHNAGREDDVFRLGTPIVFDLFPREAGGGYFFDFTRTWCLGYAPDEVAAVYEDVRTVFETVSASLMADTPCRDYQIRTCEQFQALGHPTVLSDPKTEDGYVHGLGHGVGLDIHELPRFGTTELDHDLLVPGTVITFEPGLYYPDRGLGVRLEDTLWVRPDGGIEPLAAYPLDLVLEMQ